MILIAVLHATPRIGLLTHRAVGTHRAIRLAEPVILLAIHRILLSAVQTIIAPMILSALHPTPRTAARSVSNMMAFIAVVMRYRRVAHRAAAKGLVVLQVFFVRTLAVLRFLVAMPAKLAMAGRAAHDFLLGDRGNAFDDRAAARKRANAAWKRQSREKGIRFWSRCVRYSNIFSLRSFQLELPPRRRRSRGCGILQSAKQRMMKLFVNSSYTTFLNVLQQS